MLRMRVLLASLAVLAGGPSAIAQSTNAPAPADAPSPPAPAAAPPAPEAAPAAPATTPAGPVVAYVTLTKKPTFVAQSVGSAEFAVIGAIAAMSAGDKLVATYNIDDPSVAVAAEVAKLYAAKQGASLASAPLVVDNGAQLKSLDGKGARYVVTVATYYWGYSYFSFDWGHYGAFYGAVLAIYDTTTDKTVAKGKCLVVTKKQPDSPTYDQMVADNAAKLKALLAGAGETCLDQLKAKVPELS